MFPDANFDYHYTSYDEQLAGRVVYQHGVKVYGWEGEYYETLHHMKKPFSRTLTTYETIDGNMYGSIRLRENYGDFTLIMDGQFMKKRCLGIDDSSIVC